jgi:hypothetical protein
MVTARGGGGKGITLVCVIVVPKVLRVCVCCGRFGVGCMIIVGTLHVHISLVEVLVGDLFKLHHTCEAQANYFFVFCKPRSLYHTKVLK